MGSKKISMPTEDPDVVAARNRQILDLAKIDEEENKRIKQMRTVSRGVRAFRAVRGTRAPARDSAGGSAASAVSGNATAQQYATLLNWMH